MYTDEIVAQQKSYGNKFSLSFGRTSAGIVCCFLGMFETIRLFRKSLSSFEGVILF